ncbi:MAG TPA: cytochrome c-type biogenesis protein [Gemmatimonadaceae bacterium]|nr:cytochrome c-type biogenesis protein [Gemmatimonadaceae bacterium]
MTHAVVLGALLLLAAPGTLVAQSGPPLAVDTTSPAIHSSFMSDSALEAATTAIASQLRCPVCRGESIQDSPSELAGEMRTLVKTKLAAGESPAAVKAYFVSKYGEWILLDPTAHGFNLVLYAAPFVLVLGGLAVVVIAVRKWTTAARADGAQT